MKSLKSLLLVPMLYALSALPSTAARAADDEESRWLDIEVGKSYIHRETRDIARIVISDGEIAEVKSLRPGQFQVRGVKVGSTDLWVWYSDDQDHPVSYQVTVHTDLSDLIRRIGQVTADGRVHAYPLGDHIVVEGQVPDVETLEKIAAIAKSHDPEFVNQLVVAGDHQVQLNVVFAEVSRTGLRTLGLDGGIVDLITNSSGKVVGWSSLAMMGASGTTDGYETTSNALSWVWSNPQVQPYTFIAGIPTTYGTVLGLLRALEQSSLTKVLAQPTLVALSGQQAEMLSGGEVPIVISLQNSVSVDYKDYGVKMVFVPTVLEDDVIDLRVYAEVSELDQSSGVTVGSTTIPGLLTRRASSHLRIGSGMTFAMAGLLSETTSYTKNAVPLLGEIPIVGALFRTVSHERDEREMMIFVTPKLVRPLAANEVPPAPGQTLDNNPNDFELFLMGLDHRAGSKSAEPTGPIGLER